MPKSNITVSRYVDAQLGWEACVRPEDGSWALFIPRKDTPDNLQPQLWHRVGTCQDEHGDTHESFARADSPEHQAYLSNIGVGVGLTVAFDESKVWKGGLVEPGTTTADELPNG